MSVEKAKESLALSLAQFQADKSLVGMQAQVQMNRKLLQVDPEACHLGDFGSYFALRLRIKEVEREEIRDRGTRRHKALEERAERIRLLRVEMRQHPCHGCDDREDHSRIWEKHARLERDTENLERKISLKRSVIPRTFERVVQVLEDLGYVDSESLTDSGKSLKRVFAERDLLVSEVLRSGIFNDLAASEIPALLSGLLYESRSEERQLPRIPKALNEPIREIASIWAKITTIESKHGLETQYEPDFSMAWSVHRWTIATSISRVLRESDITAGDFVRHVKQIIDLLGQLGEADPVNATKYQDSLQRIDRGIVRLASVTA